MTAIRNSFYNKFIQISRNLIIKIIILILVVSVLLFVAKFSSSKIATEPTYKLRDVKGTTVSNGYFEVIGDNKYLYLLAGLDKVYTQEGNTFAEFSTRLKSGKIFKIKFLIFDRENPQKFYLSRARYNFMYPGYEEESLSELEKAEDIEKNLYRHKGKVMILLINFNNLSSSSHLKYKACNKLFFDNFNRGIETKECIPYLYKVTAYAQ